VCNFREVHPRVQQWGSKTLRCHISDGLDQEHTDFHMAEREEIRGNFEEVFGRYNDLEFQYLDELTRPDSYQFLLCSHCQVVRSTSFAIYRVLPHTPAEVFIVIGMNIALEALFEYDIPKVLLVHQEQDLPSLLRGYEVVEAISSSEVKRKLRAFIPPVIQQVRETAWKPRLLPFVEIAVQPDLELLGEETLSEPTTEPRESGKITAITVLLADNDLDFLAVRRAFLEKEGYTVFMATSPVEARDILRSGGIDLAILDLRLTDDSDERDRSGLELAKDKAFKDVSKIMISDFPTYEAVQEALRPAADGLSPAQDFVAKQDGPEAMMQAVSRLVAQIEQTDSLRGSLLYLLVDFESALRTLVDQVLQLTYGQEWPSQFHVGREPSRLTMAQLLRLIGDQRSVFEPLFTASGTYGALVTTAREIVTTRNALAHGVPGPDATEVQRVQKLVEGLLPVIRNAIMVRGIAGTFTVSQSEFVRMLVEATEKATQEIRFVEVVQRVDLTEELLSLPLLSTIQKASERGVKVMIVYALSGNHPLPSVPASVLPPLDSSFLPKFLDRGIEVRVIQVKESVSDNTFVIYDSKEAYRVVDSIQGQTTFERVNAVDTLIVLRDRFEYWWARAGKTPSQESYSETSDLHLLISHPSDEQLVSFLEFPIPPRDLSRKLAREVQFLLYLENPTPTMARYIVIEMSVTSDTDFFLAYGYDKHPFIIEESPHPWRITLSDTYGRCSFEGGADFVCHSKARRRLGLVRVLVPYGQPETTLTFHYRIQAEGYDCEGSSAVRLFTANSSADAS